MSTELANVFDLLSISQRKLLMHRRERAKRDSGQLERQLHIGRVLTAAMNQYRMWLRESDDLEEAIDLSCTAESSAESSRPLARSASFSSKHLGKRTQPADMSGIDAKTAHLAINDGAAEKIEYDRSLYMAAHEDLIDDDDGCLEISVKPRRDEESSKETVSDERSSMASVPQPSASSYQADADFFCF